ncbi:hypothetical protein KI387_043616 [Taxus chinensis]|uniref:Protein kinase domain-containing protein n=1 Tax=Taxus chinensis TaxID=29808 RepID=A0AA38F7M0_TAXCH|nr:hypothetical protein KI387_043616 [Taxus chinensis]
MEELHFRFRSLCLGRFLLITISLPFLAFYCDGACEVFRCGNYFLDYPFGLKSSGCGDPVLQPECDYTVKGALPLLNISGRQYYILQPKHVNFTDGFYNHTMRIIEKHVLEDQCDLSGNIYNQFLGAAHFRIVDGYRNVTLGKSCAMTSSVTVKRTSYLEPVNTTNCKDVRYYNSTNTNITRVECTATVTVNGTSPPQPQTVTVNSTSPPQPQTVTVNSTSPPQPVNNTKCKDRGYYNVTNTNISCISKFELPVNEIDLAKPLDQIVGGGLQITWIASNYCHDCKSDYRHCSYRKTPSFCYCNGISYSQQCRNSGKSWSAIIVGAAVGTVLLFIVLLLIVVMYGKRSYFYKVVQLPLATEPGVSKVEKFLQDFTHQMPTRYSYSELKKITNNFAYKLGEGGFGAVFKGKLTRGNLVAVKILDQSRQSEMQFMNEVATIGGIHHIHLVRLMGYCFEGIRSALVYEYMVNSSLDKFIFRGRGEERVLSWEQLYSIALGAARGIAYLHEECHSRIIHFDIKPHNILLDHDFTPKIADFGLAKLCGRGEDHMSMTATRGTPGYVAPEVWSRNLGPVTEKSDVYSFGMMLLEMVGGRKNIEVVSRPSQVYFPDWVFKLLENGQIDTMFRARPGNTEMEVEDEDKARRMTKVGLWCI